MKQLYKRLMYLLLIGSAMTTAYGAACLVLMEKNCPDPQYWSFGGPPIRCALTNPGEKYYVAGTSESGAASQSSWQGFHYCHYTCPNGQYPASQVTIFLSGNCP